MMNSEHTTADVEEHAPADIKEHTAADVDEHAAADDEEHTVVELTAADIEEHTAADVDEHAADDDEEHTVVEQIAADIEEHTAVDIEGHTAADDEDHTVVDIIADIEEHTLSDVEEHNMFYIIVEDAPPSTCDSKSSPVRKKKKRPTTCCSVPQCITYPAPGISFHRFPHDKKLKKEWEIKLRMAKPASVFQRVCSKHFLPSDYFPRGPHHKVQKLFPKSVPSQNLPKRSHDKPKRERKQNKLMLNREKSLGDSTKTPQVVAANKEKEVFVVDVDPATVVPEKVEEPTKSTKIIPKTLSFVVATQVNMADFRPVRNDKNDESLSLADILSNRVSNERCTQVNFLPLWTENSLFLSKRKSSDKRKRTSSGKKKSIRSEKGKSVSSSKEKSNRSGKKKSISPDIEKKIFSVKGKYIFPSTQE